MEEQQISPVIDWDKESPKVKEAYDLIAKANELYKNMFIAEKERFNNLIDILIPN